MQREGRRNSNNVAVNAEGRRRRRRHVDAAAAALEEAVLAGVDDDDEHNNSGDSFGRGRRRNLVPLIEVGLNHE